MKKIFFVTIIFFTSTSNSFAYLDPGTGSYLLSLIAVMATTWSWAHQDRGAIGWGCVCHQCMFGQRCDALNVLTVETQGARLFVTSLRCDFLS